MGLPPRLSAEQMHALREERNSAQGQIWSTCLSEPSTQWSQRKCNLYLHIVATLLCLFSDIKKCSIPLGFWLAGVFTFVTIETLNVEMRDRMNSSLYWDTRRGAKKWILTVIGVTKELSELAWMIWGATMYFSSESDGCADENWGFMFLMLFFLIYAALKIVIIFVAIGVACFFCYRRQRQRYNERAASSDILRSLSQVKYSALSIAQSETDEMCSVCFVDFTEEDIVTKLDCNEKHIFHQYCISTWIS